MGSEIVFLFGPMALAAIFLLGYLAARPRFRLPAIFCTALSSVGAFNAVDIVPSYSFWTQAGFYGFVFTGTSVIGLPVMLGVSKLLLRRPPPRSGGA